MPCTEEAAYRLLDLWRDLDPYEFMDLVDDVEAAVKAIMHDCAPLLNELISILEDMAER